MKTEKRGSCGGCGCLTIVCLLVLFLAFTPIGREMFSITSKNVKGALSEAGIYKGSPLYHFSPDYSEEAKQQVEERERQLREAYYEEHKSTQKGGIAERNEVEK